MQLTPYETIYLISNFFTIFIIHRFMQLFFTESNANRILTGISYFSYFLITSFAYMLLDIPIITLTLNWVIVFVISLTYDSTMQKRIIYSTYIIVLMLFPELIVAATTGYFHFSFFLYGNYSNSIGLIVTKILAFSESLLLRNYKASKGKHNVGWNLWLSSILIPISTLIYEIMFVSNDNLSQTKVILSVAILFLINIVAFYLYDSLAKSYVLQAELSVLETENTLYRKQCEIMQTSTEELQAYRHDMNNQFIALSQLIRSKRYKEAELQLSELSALAKSKIIYSASGNVVIDGLINYKLQNSQVNSIKVKTEIAVPGQLNIETTDLVTVIGNLLDNALSALRAVPDKNRILILKIVFSKQTLIIRISNTFVGEIICKDGKIVSSNRDSEHHGYGLKNVAKAVDNYKGYIDTNYRDNVFTVDIIMYT